MYTYRPKGNSAEEVSALLEENKQLLILAQKRMVQLQNFFAYDISEQDQDETRVTEELDGTITPDEEPPLLLFDVDPTTTLDTDLPTEHPTTPESHT